MFSAGGDLRRFARMNAPYLVAVNGIATGAGFSMAISGDVVFAAESTKFTEAYTKADVSPDDSSTYFLPRLVGHVKTMQLIFVDDLLAAQQALERA